MSAVPCPSGFTKTTVWILCSLGPHPHLTSRPGAERVAALAALRLRSLQVPARSLVVGMATKLTKSPHGVLVLGLELELGLLACH